ncbi:uromodulin-like [Dendropsophus ebraccatus]|uniref:uromodulin-like n=1 Tax=Dendropsophus ebraccatus TaxID=150705 RepID=UPI00383100DF
MGRNGQHKDAKLGSTIFTVCEQWLSLWQGLLNLCSCEDPGGLKCLNHSLCNKVCATAELDKLEFDQPSSSQCNGTTAAAGRTCEVYTESSSLTYLVNTKGSMSDGLMQLKSVNSWLLDHVTARFPCGVRQYTMVEFNYLTYGPVRITESKQQFAEFLNSLVAKGEGEYCGQMTMHGLELALENSPPNSFILVYTSSSFDYFNSTLIDHIYSLINITKSQVFFLITGLCRSFYDEDFLIYRDIAAASFGQVFRVSISDFNKVFKYFDFKLSRPSNSSVRLFSGDYKAGYHSGNFTIAENFTSLIITTDGVINSIRVLGPNSTELPLKEIVSELWVSMYQLTDPGQGMWTIAINAGTPYSVRVEGFTASLASSARNCSQCHPNATCEEYVGYVECNCNKGLIGDGFTCSDIDDCAYSWSNNCSIGICGNAFGSFTCDCPSGFTSSAGTCVDIDECPDRDLIRCAFLGLCINTIGNYSCYCPSDYYGDGFHCEINECLHGACDPEVECIKSLGSYTCSDPCLNHTVLDEPWRSTSNIYDYRLNCDYNKTGWYRFIGSGGVRMPESCTPKYTCGTAASMWLMGTHPIVSDGIVTRTVCASWFWGCCAWSTTVQIKACSAGYHVYRLNGTPDCDLSFCTDQSTANDTLTCPTDEQWQLRDGSYGCYCTDKYKVSAVTDIRPELTCNEIDMKATFHKCQLKSVNVNADTVALGDTSCFTLYDDPSTNTFSIRALLQAGRCGLQITNNGTHAIYKNTFNLALASTGLITREDKLAVTMSCAYPLDMMVSLDIAVNPIISYANISVGGTGQFTAYMALYQDSSYTTPYGGSAVMLSTKSMLYIGVYVRGGDTSQYVLVMKNCYATPTNNSDDAVKYYIIKDSCPNKQDTTISVLENAVSRQGRMSLQVFKFVGNYSSVYIHCAISLCDVTAGSCSPSCSGIGSRSAAVEQSYQLKVGPIIRQAQKFTNLAQNLSLSTEALMNLGQEIEKVEISASCQPLNKWTFIGACAVAKGPVTIIAFSILFAVEDKSQDAA